MAEQLNINDDVKILKLEILSKNLKQNWNLDTDLWNEEFPHDYAQWVVDLFFLIF